MSESSHKWQKLLFTVGVTHTLFCFLHAILYIHAILCHEHTNLLKTVINRYVQHSDLLWHVQIGTMTQWRSSLVNNDIFCGVTHATFYLAWMVFQLVSLQLYWVLYRKIITYLSKLNKNHQVFPVVNCPPPPPHTHTHTHTHTSACC